MLREMFHVEHLYSGRPERGFARKMFHVEHFSNAKANVTDIPRVTGVGIAPLLVIPRVKLFHVEH